MREEDIHVGDTLRVRQWNDMQREYGTLLGDINSPMPFVTQMQYLCGMTFTVKSVVNGADYTVYHSEDGSENDFYITADMLEPAFPPEELPNETLPDIDLTDFLE